MVGENCIKIKEGGHVFFQIKMKDILYTEALKDYTRIITLEKKSLYFKFTGKSSAKSFLILLSEYTEAMLSHVILSAEKTVTK